MAELDITSRVDLTRSRNLARERCARAAFPQKDEDLRPSREGRKALAAYQLGNAPYKFRMLQRLYCRSLDAGHADMLMSVTLDQIDESRRELTADIHPNVFAALPAALAQLRAFADALIERGEQRRSAHYKWEVRELPGWLPQMARDDGVVPTPFTPMPVEGEDLWADVCDLAAQALPRKHFLRPFYDFGEELGCCKLNVYQHEGADPPPGLREVVRRARILRKHLVKRSKFLPTLRGTPQDRFESEFESFVRENRDETKGFREYTALLLGLLDQDVAQALTADPGGQKKPERTDRPKWDRDTGELRFRGEVVRTVRSPEVAKNIYPILDKFQDLSWPESFLAVESRYDVQDSLAEDLKSLNTNLVMIRFRQRSRRIYWVLV